MRAVGSHPQSAWHQTSQNTRSIPSVFCFINLEVARHLFWILKVKAPNMEMTWPEKQASATEYTAGTCLPATGDLKKVLRVLSVVCV